MLKGKRYRGREGHWRLPAMEDYCCALIVLSIPINIFKNQITPSTSTGVLLLELIEIFLNRVITLSYESSAEGSCKHQKLNLWQVNFEAAN